MADITPTQELDCRGLDIPRAVPRIQNAIKGLASGDVLGVVATDPGSVADMAAFSRRTGHEILDQSEGGGEYTFLLRVR